MIRQSCCLKFGSFEYLGHLTGTRQILNRSKKIFDESSVLRTYERNIILNIFTFFLVVFESDILWMIIF